MGTVKYTGPVASFHCPTNAEIRSLKVHFSPKQLGSGDPSPENVREIVGWDGVEVMQSSDMYCVPSDYQRVEYLRIMANAHFESGYVPVVAPRIVTKIQIMSTVDADLFGFANNVEPSFIVDPSGYGANWYQRWGKTSYTMISGVKIETPTICEFGKQQVFNGNIKHTFSDTNWSSNVQSIRVGGARNTGSDMRLYYCDIYDGDNLVRRLVPCQRKTDGVLGLYDMVGRSFLTKQGSGNLECGCNVLCRTTDYEFGVLGKNKLNPKYKNVDEYSIAGAYGYWYTEPIQLLPNTTYTIKPNSSGEIDNWYWCVAAYKNNTFNVGDDATFSYFFSNTYYGGAYVFTTGPSGVIRLATNNKTKFANVVPNVDVQLELGSTATAYKPYNPNNTVYGGWVDLISGEAVRDWILNEHTVAATDGTPGGAGTGGDTNYRFVAWNLASAHLPDSERTNLAICDIMPMSKTVGSTRFWLGGGTVYAILPNDNNEYSLTIAYAERDLNTDKYSLSPTQLQTFLGYNNIWSNADYVEVEYDLHETQDILARKNFIIASQPHIETANGNIISFNTDVSAPLKECKIHFSPMQDLHGYDRAWIAGSGKNLLDMTSENIVIGKYINNSGVVTGNNNNFYNSKYIPVKASTAYTLSTSQAISYCSFMEYDVNKDFIQRTLFGKSTPAITSETITTTANTAYVLIGSNVKYATINVNDVQAISWQFEEGSSATSYAPYENVCPISGWTGIEIMRRRKNLFDRQTVSFSADRVIRDDNGNETTSQQSRYTTTMTRVYPLTTYTLSGNPLSAVATAMRIYYLDDNGNWIKRTNPINTDNISSFNFTTPEKCYNVQIQCGITNDGSTWQLEPGSTTTTYESYTGTTLPVDWTTEAGTMYGGYVDLLTGEVVQTHAKITLNGTETIARTLTSNENNSILITYALDSAALLATLLPEQSAISGTYSHGIYNPEDSIYNIIPNQAAVGRNSQGTKTLAIINFSSSIYTGTYVKDQYDNGTPLEIVYPLQTPITYQLTPTQLKSLKGQNNIWSNANGNIEIQYWRR